MLEYLFSINADGKIQNQAGQSAADLMSQAIQEELNQRMLARQEAEKRAREEENLQAGLVEIQYKNYEKALQFFSEVLRLNPNNLKY